MHPKPIAVRPTQIGMRLADPAAVAVAGRHAISLQVALASVWGGHGGASL